MTTIAALLGHRVAQLRRASKLTQAQLAARSGICRPIVSRIERGTHKPMLATVMRLAKALRVEPYELLCVLDLHSVPKEAA